MNMSDLFFIKQKLIAGEINVDINASLCGLAYYLHSIGRKMDRQNRNKFFEW